MAARTALSFALAAFVASLPAQDAKVQASGGPLLPEQACYDVQGYDLALRVDPAARTIAGTLTLRALATAPAARIALHLDQALRVDEVTVDGAAVAATHDGGLIRVPLALRADQEFVVTVRYGGAPRVARNAPWDGGFTWAQTADGKPWVATSCQGEGADLWWPCKDHPSDKPSRMELHIAVPAGLVCAANGRLVAVEEGKDGWRTFHWRIGVPIANYCVALNIAPYEVVEATYESTAGDRVPVAFYVLAPDRARAAKELPEFLDHLRHMEEVCGPYPFRGEKYGIAQTPHLGMEHQTIIAYGNRFRKPTFDYDWLHHHEMSHEWWANLVTCRDWKDMWIHEGIGTYMQGLYVESRRGHKQYLAQVGLWRRNLVNRRPVAPRETQDSRQIYFGAGGSNDIYYKGACILHTLRWLAGDERFFVALRRLAYPDPEMEKVTDGSCVRFEDTDGVQRILEQHIGQDLGWFFAVYLRQPELPALVSERGADGLQLRWEAPGGLPFPMPVPVVVAGHTERIAVPAGGAHVPLAAGAEAVVDPEGWVLRAPERGR